MSEEDFEIAERIRGHLTASPGSHSIPEIAQSLGLDESVVERVLDTHAHNPESGTITHVGPRRGGGWVRAEEPPEE